MRNTVGLLAGAFFAETLVAGCGPAPRPEGPEASEMATVHIAEAPERVQKDGAEEQEAAPTLKERQQAFLRNNDACVDGYVRIRTIVTEQCLQATDGNILSCFETYGGTRNLWTCTEPQALRVRASSTIDACLNAANQQQELGNYSPLADRPTSYHFYTTDTRDTFNSVASAYTGCVDFLH